MSQSNNTTSPPLGMSDTLESGTGQAALMQSATSPGMTECLHPVSEGRAQQRVSIQQLPTRSQSDMNIADQPAAQQREIEDLLQQASLDEASQANIQQLDTSPHVQVAPSILQSYNTLPYGPHVPYGFQQSLQAGTQQHGQGPLMPHPYIMDYHYGPDGLQLSDPWRFDAQRLDSQQSNTQQSNTQQSDTQQSNTQQSNTQQSDTQQSDTQQQTANRNPITLRTVFRSARSTNDTPRAPTHPFISWLRSRDVDFYLKYKDLNEIASLFVDAQHPLPSKLSEKLGEKLEAECEKPFTTTNLLLRKLTARAIRIWKLNDNEAVKTLLSLEMVLKPKDKIGSLSEEQNAIAFGHGRVPYWPHLRRKLKYREWNFEQLHEWTVQRGQRLEQLFEGEELVWKVTELEHWTRIWMGNTMILGYPVPLAVANTENKEESQKDMKAWMLMH